MVGDPDRDRGPLRPRLSDARPGLRSALERIAAGEAQGLVVPGLRRLTRSVAELGPIIEWCARREARLVAVAQGLDTSERESRIAARLIIEVSRWERERLSESLARGPIPLAHVGRAGRRRRRPADSQRGCVVMIAPGTLRWFRTWLLVAVAVSALMVLCVPARAATSRADRASVLLVRGAGLDRSPGSERVRALQRRLRAVGVDPGPVDGRFGALTEAAVRRFQSARGLVVDGIVGPRTRPALRAPVPLARGAGVGRAGGSRRVRALQRQLRAAGAGPGPVDGRFGARTEAAVRRFQRARGLAVDGIVGPHTTRRLARHHKPAAAPTRQTNQTARHERGDTRSERPPITAERRGTPTRSTDPVGIAVLVAVAVIALALLLVGGAHWRKRRARRARGDGPWRRRGRGRAGTGAGPRLGGGAATQTRAPARAQAKAEGRGPHRSHRPGRPGRNRGGRPARGRRPAAQGARFGLCQRAG